MKKIIILLVLVFCSTCLHTFGQLKIDIPHFTTLFNEGKYKDVFEEAYALRNQEEYGKLAILDYFMAKALCGDGNFTAASKGFEFILKEYALNKNQKSFILDEFSTCQKAEVAAASHQEFLFTDFKMINAPIIPVSRVAGKMGYVLNCKSDTEAYKFNPDFNREELQKRLFAIDEKEKAVKYYKSYLGEEYNVNTSGRYIFITQQPYNLSSTKVKFVSANMEKAYEFIHSFYSVRPPDKLIAVYLMRDKETLSVAASKVHGLKLPESTIGYSCLDDLSILGNSDADNIGTIYHELFHLMIRTDLGDIPAWLDEGIACLYETSTWKGNFLKGDIKNWRTDVLKEKLKSYRKSLPQLRTIIDGNWGGFILNEKNSPCDVALNYAVAKHFAIYMQEQQLLLKMVDAFKARKNVFVDTLAENENSLALVERVAGMNIDQLQLSFDKWMINTYQFDVGYAHRDLESEFQISHEVMNIYEYDQSAHGRSIVASEKYKELEKTYLLISSSLEDLKSKNKPTNPAGQYSPKLIIPEGLEKQIYKYINDASSFVLSNPQH